MAHRQKLRPHIVIQNEECGMEEFYQLFITSRKLHHRKVEFKFNAVVQEVCIYIDGQWSGYFDEETIAELDADSSNHKANVKKSGHKETD